MKREHIVISILILFLILLSLGSSTRFFSGNSILDLFVNQFGESGEYLIDFTSDEVETVDIFDNSCPVLKITETGTKPFFDNEVPKGTIVQNIGMDGYGSATKGVLSGAGLDGCVAALVIYCDSAELVHIHWNGAKTNELIGKLNEDKKCGEVILVGGYASSKGSKEVIKKLEEAIKLDPCLKLIDKTKTLSNGIIRTLDYNLDTHKLRIMDDDSVSGKSQTTYYDVTPASSPCQCKNQDSSDVVVGDS